MATELESYKNLAREVETQMGLLEQKVASVASLISQLKGEKRELAEERDALAEKMRSLEERLSGIDMEGVETRLNALREENELLLAEREAVARRIGELLDKLDLLSS